MLDRITEVKKSEIRAALKENHFTLEVAYENITQYEILWPNDSSGFICWKCTVNLLFSK